MINGTEKVAHNVSSTQNRIGRVINSAYYPWIIFAASLAVRLIHIAFLKEGFYFSDYKAYERASLTLMAGGGLDADYNRPPLYPFFLAFNYMLFGIHIFPIRIVQALLGAFSSVLLFHISQNIFGRKAAHISAWISVIYPYYIFIAGLLYPTQLVTFLLVGTIYFLIESIQRKSIWNLLFASISLGIASLAIPACLAFLPFIIIWYFFQTGFRARRALLYGLLHVIIVSTSLSPWIYYCYERFGRLVLVDPRVEKHLPIIQSEGEVASKEWVSGSDRIAGIMSNPGKFLANYGSEFLHFWKFVPDRVVTRQRDYREEVNQNDHRMVVDNPYASSVMNWISAITYGPVFIFAIVGVLLCFNSWRLFSLPLMLLLSHAFAYSLFFTQTRYRLPVEFCLMILAGGGAAAFINWIQDRKKEA